MSTVLPFHADTGQRLELEHGWEFYPDRSGRLRYEDLAKVKEWRPSRVGLSWNVQFDDLRDYMGAAWYRLTLDIPRFAEAHHVLLKFGAVDYFCEVYINGRVVGSHEGGYTPFSFDICNAVHSGENEIAIRVVDPPMNETENRELFPEMMYNEIPHGKQSWYVQNSGIWQGVRLEFLPLIYIDGVHVTPRGGGAFDASVRLAGMGLMAGEKLSQTALQLSIFDATGRTAFVSTTSLDGTNEVRFSGIVQDVQLWSAETPALYMMEARLLGGAESRRRVRFGFRTFQARDGKLFLNGKPFYLMGALDQDFYPETIHTPASEQFVRDMMMKAKELGVNVLRCHLKVAHPVYLDVADELGLMVWAEMPSWSDSWFPSDHFSLRAATRGEKMFAEIMQRDWNHPCIASRTVMNESWGINLKQEEQRKWLLNTFEKVRSTLQPLGRLVIDNSACEGNFHLKTDIEDFHQYYSMPDQVKLWDKWLAEFASRPAWTFSPYGDAERTGKEPLVVSEFGNWGLPKLPGEALPWWFFYSFGGREVTNPAGVFERFRAYGFDKIFESYNEFAEQSQWHQFISIKYEIESMRAYPSIQGYVVTAMTDVHWEVNGLLDMWRNPKLFASDLARIQKPDVVIARPDKWSAFAGENMQAHILLSHYSTREMKGARLRWSTDSGASGVFTLPEEIPPATVQDLGTVQWKAPEDELPFTERIHLELRGKNGGRLADNTCEVFIVAKPDVEGTPSIWMHDPGAIYPELASELQQRGYNVGDDGALCIATKLDDTVWSHCDRGGTALLLIDAANAFPSDVALKSSIRAGCELDGRWFSNFNWIRMESEVFRDIAFGRILGFESTEVASDYVIEGIAPEDFSDVLSGATFGWLNKNSGLVLQCACNGGRLLATVFRFHNYATDAYSAALLGSLIRYAANDEWKPKLRLSRISVATQG